MQPTACLFDLDGTLLDSLADLGTACNVLLEERGYPRHPLAAYRRFVGNGFDMLVRRCLPPDAPEHRDPDLLAAAMDRARDYYGTHWAAHSRAYPGIVPMLEALAGKGVILGVLTNKPHAWAVPIVEHFYAGIPFAVVRGAMPGVPRKPDAGAVAPVLDILGLPASACAYVGDSDVDVQTARATGMLAVGAGWGFRGAEELRAAGARHILATPEELPPLLCP